MKDFVISFSVNGVVSNFSFETKIDKSTRAMFIIVFDVIVYWLYLFLIGKEEEEEETMF